MDITWTNINSMNLVNLKKYMVMEYTKFELFLYELNLHVVFDVQLGPKVEIYSKEANIYQMFYFYVQLLV